MTITSRSRPFKAVLVSTYELGRQPFGLASPAAWLQRAGIDVVQADVSIEDFPGKEVRDADLVAFYVPMHTATRLAVPLASRARELNANAHLCFYGLYAPVNESFLRSLGAQTILGGEFENGLLQLCNRLRGASVTDGDQEEPVVSLARQHFHPPDRTGLPDLSRYARLFTGDGHLKTVGYTEASRGCKHLCRHCPVVPVYGGRFRIVQPEIVLDDVAQQVASGAGHITFGDPDFFNGIGHALPLVEALHGRFPDVTYDVTVKIEHLLQYRRYLPRLKDTGCALITTAVESLDNHVLTLLDKGHTVEDFFEVVDLFKEHGLVMNPTFIPFTPWITLEGYARFLDTLAGLDLIEHVSPVQLTIRLLIPGGSKLLDLAEVRGLAQPFAPEALSHPWAHPDARLDRLQLELTGLVTRLQNRDAGRREIFRGIRAYAHRVADQPAPEADLDAVSARQSLPRLTEPWYC
ncbi:MAG: CUAEP/CCAEP-tail radical SAM protein [Gemmatimonadota bacterium]|nr:CUAEP/CCAEP-tail radical SAM protein [Gemmatimonadota bacterium]